ASDLVAELCFDWVWLLSVWQTGRAGQRISRSNPEWRREFEHTLPDLHDEDIPGSGFAITGYTVHRDLGGEAALARVRKRLDQRGLPVKRELAPNHTGLGHPRVEKRPQEYAAGPRPDPPAAPRTLHR